MNLHVLIIDDNVVDREGIRRYLRRPGFEITVCDATTGAEGLDQIGKTKFDCVFLDYRLPDMDGISLLRKIYDSDTDLPPFPVVMLTGQGNEAVMADALRWGAQDYIIKGNINPDTLQIAMAKAREVFELKKSRRAAEEHLRQSQKMEAVGQLTSGVAHDFNNLLTVVLGNTRLLQKKLQANEAMSDEDLARRVQAIDKAARRGAELVRRLMIFTRQRPLAEAVVDINACVAETFELLRRSLGEMIEIRFIPGETLWPVEIDSGQFENALINIAVNALDAMPRGGKLTIETRNIMLNDEYTFRNPDMAEGPYVMIAISDTGTGMPEAVRQRIFEPFYTTKAAGEGTGLGLSMVYGLLRQSGGHVHVYSEEGHGTVFRIYLPRMAEDGAGAGEIAAHGADSAAPCGTETLLVVEDDDEVRGIAQNMLERMGYKILIAKDGRTALEILKRQHKNIDLIFTDIVMPGGLSGADLVRQAQEYYPGVRVLYTSGYTENTLPDYQLIASEHLIGKPYRREALAQKIRQVLDHGEQTHAE